MPEIQVIFPAPVSDTEQTHARVLTSTLVASQHDSINWVFYNCDKRIRFAEIVFSDKRHDFFDITPAVPTRTKNKARTKSRAPRKVRTHKFGKWMDRTGNIHGDVPDLQETRPVLAKYTVRGWDSDAMTHCFSELDPEILINEP